MTGERDKTKRWLPRWSVRTLLVAVALVAVALVCCRWLTRPYAIISTHQNSITTAAEQWHYRTLLGGRGRHLKTIRFYRNGQKAMEYRVGKGYWYWSPDGSTATEEEFLERWWEWHPGEPSP